MNHGLRPVSARRLRFATVTTGGDFGVVDVVGGVSPGGVVFGGLRVLVVTVGGGAVGVAGGGLSVVTVGGVLVVVVGGGAGVSGGGVSVGGGVFEGGGFCFLPPPFSFLPPPFSFLPPLSLLWSPFSPFPCDCVSPPLLPPVSLAVPCPPQPIANPSRA